MLKDKIILLTGASSGIGKVTAKLLVSQGATLILADYNDKDGQSLCDELVNVNKACIFKKVDVSNSKDVRSLLEMIKQKFGRLDCAINNAGIAHELLPLASLDEATFDQVISVNLKGTWLCMKYEIDLMLQAGGGHIINMSSVAGLKSAALFSAYGASKHGVIGLTKSAAVEYAKQNIRVNALCPSPIRTPMFDKVKKESAAIASKVAESNPMSRLGEPEEIANTLAWLCSEGSSFITGTALPVDGGYCA